MSDPRLPIRVVVAEPAKLLCEAIVQAVELVEDFAIVGYAHTGQSGVSLCKGHSVDVLVSEWDTTLPDPAELFKLLQRESPETRCLILTSPRTVDPVLAIEAGAWGFVSKEDSLDHLRRAIRAVHRAEIWASREVQAAVIRGSSRFREAPATQRERDGVRKLSKREMEVLRLVADGLTNEQVAERLFLEVSTVKTHLMRIYRKLGVGDRTRAVLVALHHSLLATEEEPATDE